MRNEPAGINPPREKEIFDKRNHPALTGAGVATSEVYFSYKITSFNFQSS